LGAAVDFIEACFLGDVNGQVLICAPSAELSKISFKAVRNFAMQVDPTCSNRMGGKYFRLTKNELSWQPGHPMKGEIKTMAAGKTPKDGYYASVVQADEHGQPSYVNGHCDMQASVDTCWGSTGPRREKLLMHTTTAGRVKDGPYKSKIENDVEPSLLREMQYPLGQPHRTPDDYWCAFLLQLDKWELTDDLTKLDDPELFKKVNRSIGTTVQPTYYRERLHEAATGTEDTKQEVLTKDFNMWQTGRIQKWITGDRIRPLQVQKRITDCHYQDGWRVFVGCDFSHGDDLYAMVTLGVNYTPSDTMRGRFFADAVAWVLEKTMKESPNRPLYEEWVRQGWLFVSPGETFDSMLSINQLGALDDRQDIDIRFFGYDPAQSIQPINQLKAWLQTILQKKNPQATAADIASVIQQMVVPVSQTALTQNPRIAELESMILDKEPWIEFSMSPLWPWCFGNCAAEVSSSDLRRIVKGGPQPTHKIDLVHALLDALYGFDLSENRISE
jgi:phage terminase large subunit-like protein